MSPEFAMDMIGRAFQTALVIAGPLLLAGMAVGIIVAVLQAATQINESTLSFVPKLAVVLLVAAWMGPFIIRKLVGLLTHLVMHFPEVVR